MNSKYTRNETTDELKFYCQHGADECFGNILHVKKSSNQLQSTRDIPNNLKDIQIKKMQKKT